MKDKKIYLLITVPIERTDFSGIEDGFCIQDYSLAITAEKEASTARALKDFKRTEEAYATRAANMSAGIPF